MKLLLDTDAVLWWLTDDGRFGEAAARAVADETNQVLLSAAVVWEVAIKSSLGKLTAPDDIAPTLLGAGARPLPITLEHAAAVRDLPWHHGDPFDRLLIAQAAIEGATLISHDEPLRRYGVPVMW